MVQYKKYIKFDKRWKHIEVEKGCIKLYCGK